MSKSNKDLNALGDKSKTPEFPDKNILEKVNNPKRYNLKDLLSTINLLGT